ncbi:alcohol dehydrogenase catalytic domain-containing protein [Algivirga pacifica]|uniref:Zinc-binding dehydrogenase n=1 Tax=Algivirga pacifica TaxID=1162670 RepID=A0ABP9D4M1_9BACT
MSKMTIPSTYRALSLGIHITDLKEAVSQLQVVEKSTPKLQSKQVLIKMEGAACNPSDLLTLTGSYGVKKALPMVPGWVGVGTVVATGKSPLTKWLKGKRVVCGTQAANEDGTWAEYFVTDYMMCLPVSNKIETAQAANLMLNPLTAIGLIDIAVKTKAKAIVQNAAMGQVGKLVTYFAAKKGIEVIQVVRKEAQVAQLKAEGNQYVLNSSDENFEKDLRKLSSDLNATVGLDAVGGTLAGAMLNLLPAKARWVVYGDLSGEAVSGFDPMELLYQDKTIEGFHLKNWLDQQSMLRIMRKMSMVKKLLEKGTISMQFGQEATIEDATDALRLYVEDMSNAKLLLKFN